jgi:hypothetical protein
VSLFNFPREGQAIPMKKSTLIRFINFWPPYFGAGVRVSSISPDMRNLTVEMKLNFWNRNYVGTHFGGSLYSMIDPFYMLMLIENLGKNYIVWDKGATIRFKKPALGKVTAHFELNEVVLEQIRHQADTEHKVEPKFLVQILDEAGDVVTEVEKILYVKRKDKK